MQRYCDAHIHSTLSMDGRADMMAMVGACQRAGVYTICFTEHIDIATQEGDCLVDFDAYAYALEQARASFPEMSIGMGLEVGDTSATRARVIEQAKRVPLDFILLSRHVVDGLDPYYGEPFFKGRTRTQAAIAYLQAIYRSITQFPDYDALAHIGYVFKFAHTLGYAPLAYADAPELIDMILLHLIQNGKALEYNTSRWDVFGDGLPGRDIIDRFVQLGGDRVTLGSDAHDENGVAKGFAQATQVLRALGLRYVTTYTCRKPVFHTL